MTLSWHVHCAGPDDWEIRLARPGDDPADVLSTFTAARRELVRRLHATASAYLEASRAVQKLRQEDVL